MYRKLQEAREEEGFTLIELLVVVIIIGILAAIAIPVFLNQRENAQVAAAESDARNAAIAVESYFTENDAYPADQTAFDALVTSGDIQLSSQVAITYTLDTTGNPFYTLEADNSANGSGVDATYDSSQGGLQ